MNTTAAALQANVTVATIRTWCRYGAVAAIKQAGRWIIDAASLAARIRIGKERHMAPKQVELTVDTITAIGGNRWQKNGKDRVYINDWASFAGLDVSYYKSGSVSSASLGGRGIANSRAGAISCAVSKVWFDAADGKLHAQFAANAREYPVRYLDGERDTVDLVQATFDGIRAAVAAL